MNKTVLTVLFCLLAFRSQMHADDRTSRPYKKAPFVGMTQAQVVNLYDEPYHRVTDDQGAKITFDAKGAVRHIVWNHTAARGMSPTPAADWFNAPPVQDWAISLEGRGIYAIGAFPDTPWLAPVGFQFEVFGHPGIQQFLLALPGLRKLAAVFMIDISDLVDL